MLRCLSLLAAFAALALAQISPSPAGTLVIQSFETGTDGWGPLGSGPAGTVSSSSNFHTNGDFSLEIGVTNYGWFGGANFSTPLNLSSYAAISVDIETTSSGTGAAIAFQSGPDSVWCQNTNFANIPANAVTTVTLALNDPRQITCYSGTFDLTSVENLKVFLGGGTDYLDDLRALPPPASGPPFGSFDTPAAASSNVSGSVGFTGWALSSAGISSVGIYREPNPGEATQSNGFVLIGTASSIAGSRPDVETQYPNYPENNAAGWGFLILTNELPSNEGNTGVGNGTYQIHAIAKDSAGKTTDLGTRTIVVDNKDATAPFGAIDTPAQGGTASGSAYVNFGWALTPQPKSIPTNGSTIVVYIDGKPSGHPVYNNPRADIETLFPGYANTNGAVGYLKIDTTKLTNGVHTISWGVTDSAGQKTGIGSRFFIVQN